MRWIIASACVLGCTHVAPQPETTITFEPHARSTSASFRERTGPHHSVKDVSHVEVSVRRLEGPESIVTTGAVVSTVQVELAGVWSTFPPWSAARTSKVWLPSASPE